VTEFEGTVTVKGKIGFYFQLCSQSKLFTKRFWVYFTG